MNGKLYWKNKLPFILTNLFCMILMTLFLLACGNAVAVVEMILIVWVLILMAGMGIAYRNRKKELQKLLTMAEGLQERYLIQETSRAGGRSGLLSADEDGGEVHAGADRRSPAGTAGI